MLEVLFGVVVALEAVFGRFVVPPEVVPVAVTVTAVAALVATIVAAVVPVATLVVATVAALVASTVPGTVAIAAVATVAAWTRLGVAFRLRSQGTHRKPHLAGLLVDLEKLHVNLLAD